MTEPAKPPAPAQEHPYPPPTLVPYPHQGYNGGPYPPPGAPGTFMPPFFAYPPPSDGNHPEGAPNGVPPGPYMIGLPPGVVYAYPPHPQAPQFASSANSSTPAALARPKRKQVKMACTNCASACKRCDENRPCERCIKYGIQESCVDGQRKERKKGVKRGPYKRKAKGEGEQSFNGDWPTGTHPPPATTAAAIHAVAQYTPEGYYPVYYPPPGFPLPHPHDGQPGQDGSPPHPNGQPPVMPYYIHPGAYPPFPPYPPLYHPSGTPNGQPGQTTAAPSVGTPTTSSATPTTQPGGLSDPPPQTINPSDTANKADEPVVVAPERPNGVEANGVGKKRTRGSKGDGKSKRVKTTANGISTAISNGERDKEEAAVQAALIADVDGPDSGSEMPKDGEDGADGDNDKSA